MVAKKLLKGVCDRCGKEFEQPRYRTRKFCDRKCSANARDNVWLNEEISQLKSMIGHKPLQMILEEWGAIALKNGWPKRTDTSIKVKFKRLDVEYKSFKSSYDNWSIFDLAKKLDVPHDRIQKWEELGLIVKRYSIDNVDNGRAHKTAISQVSLRNFAVSRPDQMWGIDPKKLTKFIGDSKLAHEIAAVAVQPTSGRAMVVIRLDNGEVYPSARNAAAALDITKTLVLKSCQKDNPCRNGMNFARIDYPVYWVPCACREEFNRLSGECLYHMYLETQKIDGFKKTTYLIVSTRMAVQISLFAFRRNIREASENKELTAKDAIAKYWQERHIDLLNKHVRVENTLSHKIIQKRVMSKAYSMFTSAYKDEAKRNMHLETFANDFIGKQMEFYFNKMCLPKHYKPINKLEYADIYGFIDGSVTAYVYEKQAFLITLCARYYIKKNNNYGSYNEAILAHQKEESNQQFDETFDEIVGIVKTKLSLDDETILQCLKYLDSVRSGDAIAFSKEEEENILNILKKAAVLIDSPF